MIPNTTIEIDELKEKFENLFEDDPLFIKIKELGFYDDLMSDCVFYEQIKWGHSYKTKQAAELLQIQGKEQNLRNYLQRNDLNDYLNVYKAGVSNYRFDYEALFKFKMIFLLIHNAGMNPLDIAAIVGTSAEYRESSKSYRAGTATEGSGNAIEVQELINKSVDEKVRDAFAALIKTVQTREETNLKYHQETQRMLEEKHSLMMDLKDWEIKISLNVVQLESLENNLSLYESLLKKSQSSQQASFLQRMLVKPPSTLELEEYTKSIEQVKQKIEKIMSEKKELEVQKEEILESLRNTEKNLLALKQNELGRISRDTD